MKVGEVIYNVQNLNTGGFQSDDNNLSDRQVIFIANYHRARIVEGKGKDLPSTLYQTLACIPLIHVEASECCEIELDCPVLRTELPVPDFILQTVHTIDRSLILPEIDFSHVYWDQYSKFAKKFIKFYRKGGYIYILGTDSLEYISITGIAEQPEAVSELDCKLKSCDYNWLEQEWPFPLEWMPELMERIIRLELRQFNATFNDINNNAKGETSENNR